MEKEIVKVSSKGQIVLPASMRKKMKIDKGRKLVVVEKDGVLVMKPIKKLSEMGGILKTKKSTRKMIKELRAEWELEPE